MIAPFLRAFMMKKNHSEEFKTLWTERRTNRPPLVFTVLVRLAIAAAYIFYIANYLTRFADALLITIAFGTIVLMVLSRSLKKRSIRLERLFVQNLRSREIQAEALGRKRPLYEGRLLDRRDPHESLRGARRLALGRQATGGARLPQAFRRQREQHPPRPPAHQHPQRPRWPSSPATSSR